MTANRTATDFPYAQPSGWRLLVGGSSRVASQRLTATVESFATEVELRIARDEMLRDGAWHAAIRDQLAHVRAHHAKGEIDAAWRCFMQAARWVVDIEEEHELRTRAVTQRHEAASNKLSPWRSQTIVELLATDRIEGQLPNEIADVRFRLSEATRQRDDSGSNSYYKLALVRWQRTLLVGVLLACLAGVLVLTAMSDWKGDLDNPPVELIVLVLLFGAVGGCLSAIQSLGRPSGRIPEHLSSSAITLSRPVLGAAAALGLYAVAASGALNIDVSDDSGHLTVLGLAFAAGFSERVVVTAVGTATGSKE